MDRRMCVCVSAAGVVVVHVHVGACLIDEEAGMILTRRKRRGAHKYLMCLMILAVLYGDEVKVYYCASLPYEGGGFKGLGGNRTEEIITEVDFNQVDELGESSPVNVRQTRVPKVNLLEIEESRTSKSVLWKEAQFVS